MTTDASEEARLERRARRTWVGIVVGLLGLQVVSGITTVVLATGDSTAAVIPNYHQSAVNWDSTRRARQLTEKLGLKVVADVAAPIQGKRVLRLSVKDAAGQPVEGLHLHAQVYHHARGSDIYKLSLQEQAPGHYFATTTLTQAGAWQLQVRLEGDHGIAEVFREIQVQ